MCIRDRISSLHKPSIKKESQQLLRLAIPLIGAQLAQSLTGFIDTIMMGRLGAEVLAAGGLASLTFHSLLVTLMGLLMGLSPLIAEAFGAGDSNRIRQLSNQGFWLVIGLAIPSMIAIAKLDAVMGYLGQAPTTIKIANVYLDIIMWSCFPALGFAMMRSVISALSQTKPIMEIVTAGTLVNIFGNYALGFGNFGLPRLGLAGLAWASTISHWGMFLALLTYIRIKPQLQKYRLLSSFPSIQKEILTKLIRLGMPILMFLALEVGLFVCVTYLMGVLGTEILAAHQIVLQTVYIIFMVPLGISYATTIRVGQWLGRNNLDGVRLSGYVSLGIGLLFATVNTILMLIFPRLIISFYIDINNPSNAQIITLALPMLMVGTLAQAVDGMQKISHGLLQGLQDTSTPMYLSIPAFWLIGLPTGYLLAFKFGWNGTGLWIGQSLGLALAAILFVYRFQQLLQRLSHQQAISSDIV